MWPGYRARCAIQIEGWLKWNEPGDQIATARDRDRERKASATRDDAKTVLEHARKVRRKT